MSENLSGEKPLGDFLVEKSFFLSSFKQKFSKEDIKNKLRDIKNLRVLIIGDIIIDKYTYCEVLERAKKEPVLVFKETGADIFAGGILSIANHVAEFCDNVFLLTCKGNDPLINQIIDERLNFKIQKSIYRDALSETLVKNRHVETYRKHKVFETYNKDPKLPGMPELAILSFLEREIENFDVVIVGDFGHGMITDKIKDLLIRRAKYLAVNVQTNSGNAGFNVITKFNRADFISITKEELELAIQQRGIDLRILTDKLKSRIMCDKIAITLGKHGILYSDKENYYYSPIFSTEVVDTVGAGDAVFSIISLLSYLGMEKEALPFVGNCVGAIVVKTLGNKEPARLSELESLIDSLLT